MFRTGKINKMIKALGGNEILIRGAGYWYFAEGRAASWPSSSVYVFHLNDLSPDRWIEEYKTLRDAKF